MYMDLYFLANWVLDFLLLYLTGRIMELKVSWWRMIAVSALSAGLSAAWWWMRRGMSGTIWDFLVAALLGMAMVILAWGRCGLKVFWIRLGWLFGLGILLNGMMSLCRQWLQDGLSPLGLFCLAALLLLSAGAGIRMYYHFSGRGGRVGEVTCVVGGQTIRFYGWLDSGNLLKDPVGHRPVIIVEEGILKELRPADSIPIPYRAIGSEGKVLWGFCPDELRLRLKNQERIVTGVVAGISQPIRVHGCRAILPAQWCVAEKE